MSIKNVGPWCLGMQCPACEYATQQNWEKPRVCPKCGQLYPNWKDVAVRWVTTRAGRFSKGQYEVTTRRQRNG